jgi:hypothetical protein
MQLPGFRDRAMPVSDDRLPLPPANPHSFCLVAVLRIDCPHLLGVCGLNWFLFLDFFFQSVPCHRRGRRMGNASYLPKEMGSDGGKLQRNNVGYRTWTRRAPWRRGHKRGGNDFSSQDGQAVGSISAAAFSTDTCPSCLHMHKEHAREMTTAPPSMVWRRGRERAAGASNHRRPFALADGGPGLPFAQT